MKVNFITFALFKYIYVLQVEDLRKLNKNKLI